MGNQISLLVSTVVEAVKAAASWVVEKFEGWYYYRIIIDAKNNPRAKRAVFAEITSQGLHRRRDTVQMEDDGPQNVEFVVANGTYGLKDDFLGTVWVDVSDEQLILKVRRWWNGPTKKYQTAAKAKQEMKMELRDLLHCYQEYIYRKHNTPSKGMAFYTLASDGWGEPCFRIPDRIPDSSLTPELKWLLKDANHFIRTESKYKRAGVPFRRGYLLHGEPGTGKSTFVDLLAAVHHRSVYSVVLNDVDMSDAKLVRFMSRIDPHSIVVFDEMEKQWGEIAKNDRAHISVGGLLNALDGPQRLPPGTIVVLTSNSPTIFETPKEQKALLRAGRIDVVKEMKTLLEVNLDDWEVLQPSNADSKGEEDGTDGEAKTKAGSSDITKGASAAANACVAMGCKGEADVALQTKDPSQPKGYNPYTHDPDHIKEASVETTWTQEGVGSQVGLKES